MKHILEWAALILWPLAGLATLAVAIQTLLGARKSQTLAARMEAELAEGALLRKQMKELLGDKRPKEPPPS